MYFNIFKSIKSISKSIGIVMDLKYDCIISTFSNIITITYDDRSHLIFYELINIYPLNNISTLNFEESNVCKLLIR